VESPAEREARIRRLEDRRVDRRAESPLVPAPVEVAPGRGDLNRRSVTVASSPGLGPLGGYLGGGLDVWPPMEMPLIGGTTSYALLTVEQPWIGAAVMRLLMWAVRVPLKCYRRTGDDSRERLRPGEHEVADAIVAPWDRGSQADLVQALLGPMLVHGNSVTVFDETDGRLGFSPKDWRYVRPISPWRGSVEGFRVDTDQREFSRDVSIDELVHCAWWSPLGPIGTSPLTMLGTTVSTEDAAQRWTKAIYTNGARPASGIIASEEFLGLDVAERQQLMAQLRADLTSIYAGPENAGRPALLPPGLDWKAIGHTAVEAQLIESRKVAREEICGVYMIPPPLLGILDKATYSNIDAQKQMIYTDAVGPPLVLIEQALNAQLVRSYLRETDIYLEFDFGHVLRGSRLDEITALRTAIGTALLSPNEGRTALNLSRVEEAGMDDLYLPFNNLQPVGSPPKPSAPPTAPAAPTDDPVGLLVKSRDGDYLLEPA
jgi:HK97 family phage portal protein